MGTDHKIPTTVKKQFRSDYLGQEVQAGTSSPSPLLLKEKGTGVEVNRLHNKFSLKSNYTTDLIEAGCDEAGRGCLAGPVFAAAVILPKDYRNELLDDSKKLSATQRYELRPVIESQALAWAISSVSSQEIDEINILQASFLAMHKALKALSIIPQLLIIDGNRFTPYEGIPHHCIVKGDGIYMSVAAASVLAKTYRDDFMRKIHEEYPVYNWISNKGYPSKLHRERILEHGICSYHRKSFNLTGQLKLPFN